MIHFLYYVYVRICSLHPHVALNKVNGLAATAPSTPHRPCPSPLVDVPNWVDDVYLKRRGTDASIGSRFAESEPYDRCVVFLLPQWTCRSPVKLPSIYNVPAFAPASWSHQGSHFLHRLRIIHPADCPRFAEPGPPFFPMVPDSVQPPSATLRGAAATIPPLDFDLSFVLFYSHRPYNSPSEDFYCITNNSPPEDFACITSAANERHSDESMGNKMSAPSSSTATSGSSNNNTNTSSSN